MSDFEPSLIPYDKATQQLREADVLLYRGKGLLSKLIQLGGRGPWSHAAVATQLDGDWFVAEVREWYGGRIVSLDDQVRRYPGQIDIFRPKLTEAPASAVARMNVTRYMRRRAGCDYGWDAVLQAAVLHLPLVRIAISKLPWLCKFVTRAYERRISHLKALEQWPYCSMAIDAAFRSIDIDIVPHLDSRLTEPSDLARSYFLQYVGTIGAKQ